MPRGRWQSDLASGVRRLAVVLLLSMVLQRAEPEMEGSGSAVAPTNKLAVASDLTAVASLSPLLNRQHGEEEDGIGPAAAVFDLGVVLCPAPLLAGGSRASRRGGGARFLPVRTGAWGRFGVDVFHLGRRISVALVWLPTQRAGGRLLPALMLRRLFNLRLGRLFIGFMAASIVLLSPSGKFPDGEEDGRRSSPFYHGGD